MGTAQPRHRPAAVPGRLPGRQDRLGSGEDLTALLDLDLVEASQRIRAGELDPVELAEACLARIEDTAWANAWVTVAADGALEAAATAAREVAAGRWRGPLHGIPVGVKDLVDTAGLRTTYGSGRYADHVPQRDAAVVTQLRDAGAVILGKQATHEFAWGGRTDNPHFGPTRNPHDPDRVPGGSSGGGAASVALRSSLLAVGTDTAGSVRIPAALSGCVGFKPSIGWMSLEGVYPLAPSLDHVGLMTRTVADVALAFEALTGRSAPEAPGALRIGVPSGQAMQLEPAVREGLERAREQLASAGATILEVPDDSDLDRRPMAALTLVRHEAEQVHREAYRSDSAAYGPDLAALLELGPVGETELREAREVMARSVQWLRSTLAQVDVVLTATVPILAPRIGEMTAALGGHVSHVELVLTRLTSLANAAGAPSLSVPAGTPGLPVGVQLTGRAGADAVVLDAGLRLGTGLSGQS